ncbi:MAG TPA: peptidyl-prolyl cis-trans isomerase [Rubricoccaceae bacterium]|jgi:peptidylprolyl isomerase/peptidyl-prolyl cis-trans isomerase D
MNKMRERTSLVLYVLIGAFGILWVLQDSGYFDAVAGGGGGGTNIATVDGIPVEAELFNNRVEQQVQGYQAQGVDVSNAIRQQIETQTYDELVTNALIEREMDELGIAVTDEEVYDLINGPTPDPLIAQVFSDGQGGINRAQLTEAARSDDPEILRQLGAIEEQVRRNRRTTKLQALVSAAVRVTDADVDAEFIRRSRTADARVVALRYADVPDTEVEVSDSDLRAYYDAHRDDYERAKTWAVEVVSFDKAPTRADSVRAIGEVRNFARPFAAARDAAAYARQNSFGTDASPAYVSAGDLAPELASAVYSDLRVGRVVGPVVAGDQAVVARITGVRPAASPLVHARHILLPATQGEQARELKARLDAGQISFAQAARQYSVDESNKARGGDLGWFARGRMVGEFDTAVFGAPVGRVVGPVSTQFGLHLILVEGTSNQEAELVQISRPVQANTDAVRERAEDFVVLDIQEEERPFAEAAREKNLTITPLEVQEDQPYVPSLDVGRELVRFLRTAEVGDVSDPFDAGDRFAVVHVVEIKPAGVTPFEEVRDQIETDVSLEKKRAVTTERLAAAVTPTATLAAIGQAVRQTPVALGGLSMNSPAVEGFGNEPRLVGAAFGLQPGQRSGVVEGEGAAFVVQTTALRGGLPAELTAETRTQIREELLQRRRQQVAQAWIKSLRDEAEVEDFRADVLG